MMAEMDSVINIDGEAVPSKKEQPPIIVFSNRFAESMIYDHCLFNKLYKIEKQKKSAEGNKKCWFFYPDPECISAFKEIANGIARKKLQAEEIAQSGSLDEYNAANLLNQMDIDLSK